MNSPNLSTVWLNSLRTSSSLDTSPTTRRTLDGLSQRSLVS